MKSNYGALGKTRVSSGKVPYGTVMPDPSGESNYYVVKENRSDFDNLQRNVLDKAFGFIKEDNRRQSDAFDLYIDKKPVKIIGRKEYSNGQMHVVYYSAYPSGGGTRYGGNYQPDLGDPVSFDGKLATPEDIENYLIPTSEVQSTFPSKTSKALENELERQ